MEKIELNHWFATDNELSISLMRYFVKINICQNNKFIFYRLEVFDEGKVTLVFNFYSLSDAIHFTEKIIQKCTEIPEIVQQYISRFQTGEFNQTIKNEKIITPKISLIIIISQIACTTVSLGMTKTKMI